MKNKNDRAIIRVVLATGISSVVTQLLTIRELLSQFQGNEIVIALILFAWLILGGIGTLLARLTIGSHRPASNRQLARLSLVLAALPPLQLIAIRLLRDAFFVHGASVGFYSILIFIFSVLAPYCLVLGFVLPYSLFILRNADPAYPGSRIYILDNIGDVTGGVLFSFALVFLCTPLQAVLVAHLPLLAATIWLIPVRQWIRPTLLIALVSVFVFLIGGLLFETASLRPSEGVLVDYRESLYGRLTIHRDREQLTLFEDGIPLFSSQNLIMAEESVHYPLSQVTDPNRILMISAEGGVMQEIQKHNPRSVDYVELNPEVTEVLFDYGLIKNIPGLEIIHQDGRAYLSQTDRIYDVIIVNLPEPNTFQVNRFYTGEFFRQSRRHLSTRGVLSFSVQGFDNYLAEPQRKKISALYNTAGEHFKHILMLPGQRIYFLCSNRPIRTDIPVLLAAGGIKTEYIQGYYYGNLTARRIEYLNKLVDPATPRNLDTAPHLMRIMFQQWFAKFTTSPTIFIGVTIVFCLIYLFRITREEFILFSTGFTTMGSEILVIFAFQIFFGYIYFQIGVIITIFLAGLLPGATFGTKIRSDKRYILPFSDALLVVLIAIFIIAMVFVGERLPVSFFLVFGFLISLTCGFQFPIALRLRGDDNPAATRLFSADLIGAACGTLFASLILIPYFGLIWAAVALIGLKLVSFVVGASYVPSLTS